MTYSDKLRRSTILLAHALIGILAFSLRAEADADELQQTTAVVSEPAGAEKPSLSNKKPSDNYFRGRAVNFIGNIDSMKFHKTDCEFARVMARRRQVSFEELPKAVQAGMSPCNWCFPKWSLTVEGKLLLPEQVPRKLVKSTRLPQSDRGMRHHL